MSRTLFVAFVIVSLVCIPAAIQAQAGNVGSGVEVSNATDVDLEADAEEPIDFLTTIVSKEASGDTMTVVLRSEREQTITIATPRSSDGGRVDERRVSLHEGLNRVEFSFVPIRGSAVYSISTNRGLYWDFERTSTSWIGGPWTAQDAQIAALAGASSVAFVAIILTFRAITGRSDEPERVA